MSADWDDKPLGYKHPPVWTQFQKGQSGNPRGRPRKQEPAAPPDAIGPSALDDALRKERERKVRVNDVNGPKDLALYEVVLRSLMNNAAKGDVRAQREVWKLLRELEMRDAQRQKAEEEQKRRTFKYICALKERQAKKWAAVGKSGGEPAEPWPHPDDILVDLGSQRWHVRGPFDDEDLPFYEYCRAERDTLFARLALDLRRRTAGQLTKASIWDIWIVWDVMLPKRWQIVDRFGDVLALFFILRPRELREIERTYTRCADELRPTCMRGPPSKETYRVVNGAMKPLLQRGGYRSLAEFEKAYDQHGEDTPWPKTPQTQTRNVLIKD